MLPRVTAILVARHGGERLDRTLEAVRTQERPPDRLVVILVEADASAVDAVRGASPAHVVELQARHTFGEAVRAADRVLEPPEGDADSLWLLAEDSAPAPDALARLAHALETGRSVAIAAPKLVDWDEPGRILHLGRSVTRYGRTVDLVADELDQGQHDGMSDVLGADAPGILVRHRAWRALEGFDPGLPSADDALDLSIRARLAGHRVSVVPEAKIAFAGVGTAGEPIGGARVVRRRRRLQRTAQLHRRLVYAPAATVPLHWLTLLPLAVVRSVGLLLVKAPGRIAGEFAAALTAMFTPRRVFAARRSLKRTKAVGWSALAPLRVPPEEVRQRRHLAADERRARARGRSEELQFLGSGGGWVLLGSIVVSIATLVWLFGAGGLAGGALLPLSGALDELWRNAAYGFRDVGAGFIGPADPFAGVLAVLGSIAFWSPSWVIVAVWFLAIPTAAMGAWFTASRLTERGSLRALAAFAFAVSPPLMTALADGRPGAVIAHALLGWLAFAAMGAARSWASAATAGLLFAVVAACAPSLVPALLLGWIVAIAVAGRAAPRFLLLPLPAAVLAAPLVWAQVSRGTPLALVADSGVAVPSAAPDWWWLALGYPGGQGGWPGALETFGVPFAPEWVATALIAPLVVAAIASVSTVRIGRGLLALGAALAGFATAVAAAQVSVATAGDQAIEVWTGAGQSLMLLGLAAAAVVALDALRRGTAWLAAIAGLAAVVAALPIGVALASGGAEVHPAADRTLPAFVVAESDTDPRVTTLTIAPIEGGAVVAGLQHGTGTSLDDQSTLAQTAPDLTADERRLAEIAGNLASRSGAEAQAAVEEFGARFVLLEPAADDRAAEATAERAQAALDGNAALVPVGDTAFGRLYRFADASEPQDAAAIPSNAGGSIAVLITVVQLVVLGATLLLSIPTGAGRESDRRPRPARPVRKRGRAAKRSAVATAEESQTDASVDTTESADAVESSEESETSEPSAPSETSEPSAPSEASAPSEPSEASAPSEPDDAAESAEASGTSESPEPPESPEPSDPPEPTESRPTDPDTGGDANARP